ncbi:hypothetical protein BDC45DRAFT_493337 [Circinella umbellata]|nr:hypothetical protein BDC45DRAFT_493337 [Circinella umbellata]
MDMANKYKHCWVLGMDDRDVLDPNRAVPRNFRFLKSTQGILHDLQKLPDNQFDFIYGRFLIFSYNPDHYREIVQECWRICRPGGYVEMMELDMRIYGNPMVGPTTYMLNAQVIHLMESRSLDPHFARYLQDLFFFHELVEQMHQQHGDAYHAKYTSLPLGLWGGRIGTIFLNDLRDLIETVHAREQNDYDPWTDRRMKAMLERVEEEFETHWAFMNLHHAYAQKL